MSKFSISEAVQMVAIEGPDDCEKLTGNGGLLVKVLFDIDE